MAKSKRIGLHQDFLPGVIDFDNYRLSGATVGGEIDIDGPGRSELFGNAGGQGKTRGDRYPAETQVKASAHTTLIGKIR